MYSLCHDSMKYEEGAEGCVGITEVSSVPIGILLPNLAWKCVRLTTN